MSPTLPKLCFIGPMVGRNPGYVTTQGEILADRFTADGYKPIAVSTHPNRYARFIDIVTTILRRRRHIDFLIINVFGGPSFVVEDAASRLGRLFGHRVIMVLRGGAMPQFMARFPRWTRMVLSRAQGIVAPSQYLADAVTHHGFAARVIPNVLDIPRYTFRHRAGIQPRLLWVRTFHDIYNPNMAIRALARLAERRPEATLVMAGQDKGLESAARSLAATLGLADKVRFPGFLSMQEKAAHGEVADVFLNTSRIDNTPVTVLEACAMGLPVVSTDVGGMRSLLTEGETGLLVPDNDDERMAGAILRLLDDSSLTAGLSGGGRALAERSSWPQVRLQWETLFGELD